MPPVINDSEDDERYSEADSSAIALDQDEEAGEQYNNLNYAKDQDSDLSSVLSDDNDGDDKQGGDDEENEEEEEEEEEEAEEQEQEQESSDLDEAAEDDTKVPADDEGEEEEEEEDEGDLEDLDEEEEEEEEEEEDIPSISDEEDNYKLEDLDEIDDDLELREEEEEEIPKLVSPAKVGARTSSRLKHDPVPATTRETRKRQLTLYDEEDEDEYEDEYDDTPKRLKTARKNRRGPEPEAQPQDLDEDLILTDEEVEYNPRANPDLSKMTERQRSRYMEEEVDTKKEFLELDDNMNNSKKARPKKTETEQQIALKKAESARRRQDYKMKVLEEEKRDTLNKLLKRRANKTREVDDKEGSADIFKLALKPRRPILDHPALTTWVSNTTTLDGNSVLRFPAPN